MKCGASYSLLIISYFIMGQLVIEILLTQVYFLPNLPGIEKMQRHKAAIKIKLTPKPNFSYTSF